MDKYYRILNLQKSATLEEVKDSYRKLSKKYHPDKHCGNNLQELATEKFKEVKEAYEQLTLYLNEKFNTHKKYSNKEDLTEDILFPLYGFTIKLTPDILNYNLFRSIVNCDIEKANYNYQINYDFYERLENFLENDKVFFEDLLKKLFYQIGEVYGISKESISSQFISNRSYILNEYWCFLNDLEELSKAVDYEKNSQQNQKINSHLGLTKILIKIYENIKYSTQVEIVKNSLYNNKEIYKCLFETINDTFEKAYSVIYELSSKSKNYIFDKEKAFQIYNKVDSFSGEELKKKIVESISIYPYDSKIYSIALIKLGDSNYQLESIGNFFGIKIIEIKDQIAKNFLEELLNKEYSGNLSYEMIEFGKFIGYNVQKFSKILILNQINNIMKEINIVSNNEGIGSIEIINELKKKILKLGKENSIDVHEYINTIQEKILKIDLELRRIIGTNIICNTKEDLEKIYSLCKKQFIELDSLLKSEEDKKLIKLRRLKKEIEAFEINLQYEFEIKMFLSKEEQKLIQSYRNRIEKPLLKKDDIESILGGIVLFTCLFFYFNDIFIKFILFLIILSLLVWPTSIFYSRLKLKKEIDKKI